MWGGGSGPQYAVTGWPLLGGLDTWSYHPSLGRNAASHCHTVTFKTQTTKDHIIPP